MKNNYVKSDIFYDNDDIQILFKTKKSLGVHDLLWG